MSWPTLALGPLLPPKEPEPGQEEAADHTVARTGPVHLCKFQHKTHRSQVPSFSGILFWSQAPRKLAPGSFIGDEIVTVMEGHMLDRKMGSRVVGRTENHACTFPQSLQGWSRVESLAPGLFPEVQTAHTSSGAPVTAAVPSYTVGR